MNLCHLKLSDVHATGPYYRFLANKSRVGANKAKILGCWTGMDTVHYWYNFTIIMPV